MRRVIASIATILPAATCLAMQQSAPPTPKVETPGGWPLLGYGFAAVIFVAAVFISVRTANRQDLDETGANQS
ncbi:MAG: hypothetical protein RJA12_282 [Planctomycetota bacterium]|jgi:hypothetical protein|nr:hypothetical protein [Pseudomonadota bacterium]NBV64417.1 hypothetical protein [Planctomycetota bacterium]